MGDEREAAFVDRAIDAIDIGVYNTMECVPESMFRLRVAGHVMICLDSVNYWHAWQVALLWFC